MRKELLLSIFLLILILPMIYAVSTDVTVKTEKTMLVRITAVDEGNNKLADKFERANAEGIVNVKLETPDVPLDITIKVANNKNVILNTTVFESHSPGLSIVLDTSSRVVNSEINSTNVTNKEMEENTSIVNDNPVTEPFVEVQTQTEPESTATGKSISGDYSIPKITYFIVGGIVLVGVILFFGMRVFNSKRKKGSGLGSYFAPIKVRKWSDIQKEKHSESSKEKVKMAAMEKKLKEAQEQIYKLKNHDRIREAERKFEKAKRDLERLKK